MVEWWSGGGVVDLVLLGEGSDNFLRGILKTIGIDDGQSTLSKNLLSVVDIGPCKTNHEGQLKVDLRVRVGEECGGCDTMW